LSKIQTAISIYEKDGLLSLVKTTSRYVITTSRFIPTSICVIIGPIFVINLVASRVSVLVIKEKYGRLGNRIWQFAHVIAFCIENGFSVSNPSFAEYSKYFKLTSRDLLCRYPARKTLLHSDLLREALYSGLPALFRVCQKFKVASEIALKDEEEQRFDLENPKNLVQFDRRKCVFLRGWLFEAPNLLRKHRSAILRFFEPLDKYHDNIEKKVAEARRNTDLLIGVHIRRGDYRTIFNGPFYYEIEDYRKFMKETAQLFPGKRVGFLIVSDERLQTDDWEGFSYVLANGHMIEDLYSLAKCDLIIGPPSTFANWASFYGNVPSVSIRDKSYTFSLDKFGV